MRVDRLVRHRTSFSIQRKCYKRRHVQNTSLKSLRLLSTSVCLGNIFIGHFNIYTGTFNVYTETVCLHAVSVSTHDASFLFEHIETQMVLVAGCRKQCCFFLHKLGY